MAKTNIKKNTEKDAPKVDVPKVEVAKLDVPKVAETKKAAPKKAATKTKVKEVKEVLVMPEPVEPTLFQKIYGEEVEKESIPFPDSELQTQTRNIVKEYDIKLSHLPENVLNSVNDLVRDFTYFVNNKNMVNMISVIMDKDLVALNLLKQWIQPNTSLLLELKKENGGDVIEGATNSGGVSNVVVNNSNVNINSLPSNPAALNNGNNVVTPENVHLQYQQPQNLAVHNVNPFVPREPVGTYQHTNNSLPIVGENKNAHHEMMTAAAPSILAGNTAQQNHAYTPEPIDMKNFLSNYASSIIESIKSTFQMNHWGYIPLDVLNTILGGSDKAYKYEVVLAGKESYLIITDGTKTIQTEKFAVQ